MDIKDYILGLSKQYQIVDDINGYTLPLKQISNISTTEQTVGIFTPYCDSKEDSDDSTIFVEYECYLQNYNYWQGTLSVYEDDNAVPIATHTSVRPSSSTKWLRTAVGFNVKAFHTYTIKLSANESSAVTSVDYARIRYGIEQKNIFGNMLI